MIDYKYNFEKTKSYVTIDIADPFVCVNHNEYSLNQYIEDANKTNAPLNNSYQDMTSIHMLMGMMTEVGELIDVYKKNLAYGKDIDITNVKEEIGDLMWYIAGFCKYNNFDLTEILQTNIKKLKQRYPDKFDSKRAINRDLTKEREILEG
jgi:NTP pyrophosphatase (non-canonical NTP hydrolase)